MDLEPNRILTDISKSVTDLLPIGATFCTLCGECFEDNPEGLLWMHILLEHPTSWEDERNLFSEFCAHCGQHYDLIGDWLYHYEQDCPSYWK